MNNTQQFFSDTAFNNRTETATDRKINLHTLNAGYNLALNNLTSLVLRAGYSRSASNEESDVVINVHNDKNGIISKANSNQYSRAFSNKYYQQFNLSRGFNAKKGRVLNFFNLVECNNNANQSITESVNEYFVAGYSRQEFNQLKSLNNPTLLLNSIINVDEPLTKKLSGKFALRYNYLSEQQGIGVYHKEVLSSKYEKIDSIQSGSVYVKQGKFSAIAGLVYRHNKLTINASLSNVWQNTENKIRKIVAPIRVDMFNILPSVSVQWKQFMGNYSVSVNAPRGNYLVPVADSSIPFRITIGNPYLRPSAKHQIGISIFKFIREKSVSFNMFGNAAFIHNDIIMKRTVQANGYQTDSAINANGSFQIDIQIGYGKQLKRWKKWRFSLRANSSFDLERRIVVINGKQGRSHTMNWGARMQVELNKSDIIEFRSIYNPGISKTVYTGTSFSDLEVMRHHLESALIFRWPKKVTWEGNMIFNTTNHVATGIPASNIFVNASVSIFVLYKDAGILKVHLFDVLGRNNNVYRYTIDNQIIDKESNVLSRYAEISFTYNIQAIGNSKIKDSRKILPL